MTLTQSLRALVSRSSPGRKRKSLPDSEASQGGPVGPQAKDDARPWNTSSKYDSFTSLQRLKRSFSRGGQLRPFRLLEQDLRNIRRRYVSDWKIFNQLIIASAVYVFFTNLLPGITFASDLYVLTGKNWGTIEVVFSTGICGVIFSFIIYFHKAIQELERAHADLSFTAFLYAIIGAVGTMLLAIFLSTAEHWKPLLHRYIRLGLSEYAAAISIIFFVGMPHIGELAHLDKTTLPVSTSFRPTSPDRERFLVEFWKLPVRWIFAAIVPALIITMLFFFDHEISSIICTVDRYRTRKPGGFAWDIMLLGVTTAICGVLGIPPANGLLPQAPLHSESLLHTEKGEIMISTDGERKAQRTEAKRVYEQRWSHFLHACGILAFISPPFMKVLGLTPTSVLAGLFLFMGEQSLSVNPLLYRFLYILSSPSELPALPASLSKDPSDTASKPSYLPIHMYTILQVVLTVAIFILTLTKGAPAFPVLIILLVPFRLLLMKRWWRREVLRFVDEWACQPGTPEDDEDAREDEEAEADTNEKCNENQECNVENGVLQREGGFHGDDHARATFP
ncbi:hypothetical protein PRK78_001382 [Emydomyces testavorans]|uniref:Bicarbonate transporter-like transmembrane domain-containing protein n=1 Tax=Emydomyces testavorans TaxID=2070801 RepID=A0AAF0IGM5_9EURO|nr:hypothetical protein PRK78_001382 [Emydomyces testavorans]